MGLQLADYAQLWTVTSATLNPKRDKPGDQGQSGDHGINNDHALDVHPFRSQRCSPACCRTPSMAQPSGDLTPELDTGSCVA